MCLILVAWRAHPRYPCIVAANRDEVHARPAEALHWWPDRPGILAGRDRQAGGTWLGVTRSGRFAALTNFRSPQPKSAAAPSRGGLVVQALDSTATLEDELARLERIGPDYQGFNVLVSDGRRLGAYASVTGVAHELDPGIYGLSNHVLDTPWPKVRAAKARLQAVLEAGAEPRQVLELLRDTQPAPDAELPHTGVGLEWERLLSSAFVLGADYGTRCSTVIRIDTAGRAGLDEWSWDPAGRETAHRQFTFEIEPRRASPVTAS